MMLKNTDDAAASRRHRMIRASRRSTRASDFNPAGKTAFTVITDSPFRSTITRYCAAEIASIAVGCGLRNIT